MILRDTKLHPSVGVRAGDKGYTSPVLALHTWSRDAVVVKKSDTTEQLMKENTGIFTADRSRAVTTNLDQKRERKLDVNTTIQVIPLEDILSIAIATAVKKAVAHQTSRRAKALPPQDQSCWASTKRCCMVNFCCCCCAPPVVSPDFEETVRDEESATRTIIVTIKYVTHSNVHTASNVKVLPEEKRQEFYKKKFDEDTVKFYYLQNEEVNEANFNTKLKEVESLARIITQIKGMSPNFPDPAQLQEIFRQQETGIFGFESNEKMGADAN